MKYCRQIFREINFEPHSLSPCCNTQGISIPAMPYEGGAIDLAEYGRAMSRALEDMQAEKLCKGCNQLLEAAAPACGDGKFSAISLNMHRHLCNCKCVYCDLWNKPDKKSYDVLPGLRSLQDQGAIAANATISWGGGEPAIYPGFEKTAAWLKANGCFQYVHTSGISFSPAIAAILEASQGRINISLDSGSGETYRQVKGVDCHARVIANIKAYAKTNPKNIDLKYIIFAKNNDVAEIEKFLDFAAATGIDSVQFSFDFRDLNHNRLSPKSLLAAAWMFIAAARRDIRLTPFFVPATILDQIAEWVRKLPA